MTASLFFASEHREGVAFVNIIVARKRELSQKPNLCLWGAWKFSPKIICTEKIPRQIIFIAIKAFKRYVAHLLKRCPYASFQLHYSRFNSTLSTNNHNNQGFMFSFSRKNQSPFSLNFLYRPHFSHRDQ